jgi:ADP-ribose pyrophosphatase
VSKVGSRFSFKDIKVLSREPVFSRFLKVDIVQLKHKMFNGGWSPVINREVTVRERVVGVLMFDPKRDEIVLVKQFRVGVMQDLEEPWILEIVAGMVGDGENFHDVANREAREESGCEILDLIDICEYYNSPGISTEKVILYCGIIDAENAGGIHGLEKEHEDIEVIVLSYKDALDCLESGYINNAMSIIALQWLMLNKNAIIKQWV